MTLLADFLGLPPPVRLQMSPDLQRRKTNCGYPGPRLNRGLDQREIGRQFGVGPHAVSKAIPQETELAAQGAGAAGLFDTLQ